MISSNEERREEIIGRTHLQYLLVYVVGLIILEGKKTMSGIAESLQLCFHDSLCRLLWYMEFPLKKLSMFFISFILRNRKAPGWLIIDGTGIPKQFSKFIECAGWAWCGSEKRVVLGIHPVVLCWADGYWKLPVGFLLWRPKDKCRNYRTKVDLALKLVTDKNCLSFLFSARETRSVIIICFSFNWGFCCCLIPDALARGFIFMVTSLLSVTCW